MRNNMKRVPLKSMKVGDEFNTLIEDGCSKMAHFIIKSVNPLFAVIEIYGKETQVNCENSFAEVPLSESEFRTKFNDKAAEVVKALQNQMSPRDNIGPHEMWNGWIEVDAWRFGASCEEHKIKVIGWFKLDNEKLPMFGDTRMDIGIVAENEDNKRFWCHSKLKWIEDMVKEWESER